jgi:hypothetical protein
MGHLIFTPQTELLPCPRVQGCCGQLNKVLIESGAEGGDRQVLQLDEVGSGRKGR